jgi:hypothetical protein
MLSHDLSGYLHAARENPMRGFAMAGQHWGSYAAISLLLAACGAAFGQKARPAPPQTVHERIEELARALQNNPRLKSLTEQQRLDRLEFVMGNTLFALLQMGHVAIDEMKLPVLGREEDEADAFATLRLLKIGSDFSSACSPNRQRTGS